MCTDTPKIKGIILVKRKAEKAFKKNLTEGNIKNIKRQIKRKSVVQYAV